MKDIWNVLKGDMNFELMQYRWYRKWKGGTYYLIFNWVTSPFWSDKMIYSCGGRALRTETFNTKEK